MSVLQCICIFAYLTPISSLSSSFTRPFGNDVATTNPIIRTTGSSSRIRCGLDCNQEPDCLGYNLREACVTGDCCQLTRGITRLVDTVNTPGMVYYAKTFDFPPPRDCFDVHVNGKNSSGIAKIYPDGHLAYNVFCDLLTPGERWNVLIRRQDGSENFRRNWIDYKAGFGDFNNEFWAGLDLMHLLTSDPGVTYRVRVDLESYQGAVSYAEYDEFVVDSEADKYRLHVGAFSGTTADSLSYHDNVAFSTPDVDNDKKPFSCGDLLHSGWWYKGCSEARLTGLYGEVVSDSFMDIKYHQGILWYSDLDKHPRFAELKIKRN